MLMRKLWRYLDLCDVSHWWINGPLSFAVGWSWSDGGTIFRTLLCVYAVTLADHIVYELNR